jgi:hypothetical protein
MNANRHRVVRAVAALAALLLYVFVVGLMLSRRVPSRVPLPDGRILQIEGVAFGTHHHIGWHGPNLRGAFVWLPGNLNKVFPVARPAAEFDYDNPVLMVWVNTLSPTTRDYVNCGRLQVEIRDEQGIVYPGQAWSAQASHDFWRCGFAFPEYPRTQSKLMLRITPFGTNQSVWLEIPNPQIALRPVVRRALTADQSCRELGSCHHRPGLGQVPEDVKTVVAEFVVLKPVQADFFVGTPSLAGR